jgi:excisionase family DNA binding protein
MTRHKVSDCHVAIADLVGGNNMTVLTIEEAATQLKVSKQTVYKLIAAGHLSCKRISRYCIRIRQADLDAYLNDDATPTLSPAKVTTSIERDILRVLSEADGPLSSREIAKRCERAFNTHFQAFVSRLKKGGIITSPSLGTYQLTPAKELATC